MRDFSSLMDFVLLWRIAALFCDTGATCELMFDNHPFPASRGLFHYLTPLRHNVFLAWKLLKEVGDQRSMCVCMVPTIFLQKI